MIVLSIQNSFGRQKACAGKNAYIKSQISYNALTVSFCIRYENKILMLPLSFWLWLEISMDSPWNVRLPCISLKCCLFNELCTFCIWTNTMRPKTEFLLKYRKCCVWPITLMLCFYWQNLKKNYALQCHPSLCNFWWTKPTEHISK